MVLGEEKLAKLSRSVFPVLAASVIAATSYVATITSIAEVPREFPFGLVRVLPPHYWIAIGLSLGLLLVAIATRVTVCLWIAAALLIFLIPGLGDLVYSCPRDTFSMTAALRISQTGAFSAADNILLSFPGSAILFSVFVIVTGASPVLVVRSFGLIYNFIVFALSFVCYRRLGLNQTPALLSALTVVFTFYLQGALIYTSLMGFIFYIPVFGLVLAPYSNRVTNTFLLTAFFAAMVISHAFSPLLTICALAAVLLGWKFTHSCARRLRLSGLRPSPPPTNPSVLVSLIFVLVIYWVYVSHILLTWVFVSLRSRSLLTVFEGTISPIVYSETIYSTSYARVAELYGPILVLPFLIYLITCRDGRKLQLVLWIAGSGLSILIAVSGYVQEFLPRVFAFAILPMCYAVSKLLSSERAVLRILGIGVLLVSLGLHLPAHYGQDSFWLVQDSTISGMQFFAAHSFFNASLDSRGETSRYYIDSYRLSNAPSLGPGSYLLLSYRVGSRVLYREGDDALRKLNESVSSSSYDRVYSNGLFSVYLENRH